MQNVCAFKHGSLQSETQAHSLCVSTNSHLLDSVAHLLYTLSLGSNASLWNLRAGESSAGPLAAPCLLPQA